MTFGVWDGHDAGVACVDSDSGEVVFAANEERYTRRKLEIGFPYRAFAEAIEVAGRPGRIVVPTTDPSKVLARLIPAAGESYYQHRRHRKNPSPWDDALRRVKIGATQLAPFPGCGALTAFLVNWRAKGGRAPVTTIDHHTAHLQAAFASSGFMNATVVSLDGVGDAASGAIALACRHPPADGPILRELARFSGRDSIGLIYEEATRLLNMRELEDEGKVMALSSHADLTEAERSAFYDLVRVRVLGNTVTLEADRNFRRRLRDSLWRNGPERFAAIVQSFAERKVVEVIEAAFRITGVRSRLAVAGGVFANVKINRRVRDSFFPPGYPCFPDGNPFWIFPHMGDGGLALGSGADDLCRIQPFLGTKISKARVECIALERGLGVSETNPEEVASRIALGEILGWVTGRMEYGPRALGARSIIAHPNNPRIRDRLNLAMKKRVFYQPFCPTMTLDEARRSLEKFDGRHERWMTSLYGVTEEGRTRLTGVIGAEASCRPQVLDESPSTEEERLFRELLGFVTEKIGIGAVLNTSFNVHGDPIVRTEEDAVETFLRSGLDALIVDGELAVTRSCGGGE